MKQFRDQSDAQFKRINSCYNPAPTSALQPADAPASMQQVHQHAADNAAGSAASDATAVPEDVAQTHDQKFKEMCQNDQTIIK